mgnify:CR=1 FL=1
MAKLALINREEKRRKLVAQYAKKRAALEAIFNNVSLSDEERYEARLKLQALPRNSSPSRLRNRCQLTGRPRGVFRKLIHCLSHPYLSKYPLGRGTIRSLLHRKQKSAPEGHTSPFWNAFVPLALL